MPGTSNHFARPRARIFCPSPSLPWVDRRPPPPPWLTTFPPLCSSSSSWLFTNTSSSPMFRLRAFQTLLDGSRDASEQKVELSSLRRLCARGKLRRCRRRSCRRRRHRIASASAAAHVVAATDTPQASPSTRAISVRSPTRYFSASSQQTSDNGSAPPAASASSTTCVTGIPPTES